MLYKRNVPKTFPCLPPLNSGCEVEFKKKAFDMFSFIQWSRKEVTTLFPRLRMMLLGVVGKQLSLV